MGQPWIALIFGGLAVVAGWAIYRDLKVGISGDGMYRFREDGNQVGYAALIGGKIFVLAFGVAEILFTIGLGDDPMLLRQIFA